MSEIHFHARQAALALQKMAKTTTDPRVAGRLVEAAADLKDQAGELPPLILPAASRARIDSDRVGDAGGR